MHNSYAKCSSPGSVSYGDEYFFFRLKKLKVLNVNCSTLRKKCLLQLSRDMSRKYRHTRQQARRGESKRKLDMDELLKLYGILDRANLVVPVFVAADLSRSPPFNPDATDFFSLASSVEFVSGQTSDVMMGRNLLGL